MLQTIWVILYSGGSDEPLFRKLRLAGHTVVVNRWDSLGSFDGCCDLLINYGLPPGSEREVREHAKALRLRAGKGTPVLVVTSWDSDDCPVDEWLKQEADVDYECRLAHRRKPGDNPPQRIEKKVFEMLAKPKAAPQ